MPASVTITFDDENPGPGANSEDGFVVLRKEGSDPWDGGNNVPAAGAITTDVPGANNSPSNAYTDQTIQPDKNYYYRIVYYRGNDWNSATEKKAGSMVGPIRVPNANELGYPDNTPDDVSGVNFTIGREPLYHYDARDHAEQRNYTGVGTLWGKIGGDLIPGERLPNKANTYGDNNRPIGDKISSYATFIPSLYEWSPDSANLDPIPVLGDRHTQEWHGGASSSTYNMTSWGSETGFENTMQQKYGVDVWTQASEALYFGEGLSFFVVLSQANNNVNTYVYPQPWTNPRVPYMASPPAGTQGFGRAWFVNMFRSTTLRTYQFDNQAAYDARTIDMYDWSSGATVTQDFAAVRDDGSGNNFTPYISSGHTYKWYDLYQGFNDSHYTRIENYLLDNPHGGTSTDTVINYPLPEYLKHTAGGDIPSHVAGGNPTDNPAPMSIFSYVWHGDDPDGAGSRKGHLKSWIDGGSPLMEQTNPSTYTNVQGQTQVSSLPTFNPASLTFLSGIYNVAEIIFFDKALPKADFDNIIAYLESRYNGYLNPQTAYQGQFA